MFTLERDATRVLIDAAFSGGAISARCRELASNYFGMLRGMTLTLPIVMTKTRNALPNRKRAARLIHLIDGLAFRLSLVRRVRANVT